MIPTQDVIGQLAVRIERAYWRRFPLWRSVCLTPGVWESAAARLLEAASEKPRAPIDPELFVAVQFSGSGQPDPWAELTQRRSLDRYLQVIRRIVGKLRQELKAEVRRAERQLLRGVTLDQVLASEGGRISPLSRYILAHRAGRPDLSIRHRAAAESQHRSCPLYRMASRSLLPSHAYPLSEEATRSSPCPREAVLFSLN